MSSQIGQQMDRSLIRALRKLAHSRQDHGLVYLTAAGIATGTISAPATPGHFMEIVFAEPLIEDASFELVVSEQELAAATRARQTRLNVELGEPGSHVLVNSVRVSTAASMERLARLPTAPVPNVVSGAATKSPRLSLRVTDAFCNAVARALPAANPQDIRKFSKGVAVDLRRQRVMASDGHRLHLLESTDANKTVDIIPGLSDSDEELKPHEAVMMLHADVAAILTLGATHIDWHPGRLEAKEAPGESALVVVHGRTPTGMTWRWTCEMEPNLNYPDVDRIIPARVNGRVMTIGQPKHTYSLDLVPLLVQFPSCARELRDWAAQCRKLQGARAPLVVLDVQNGVLRSQDDSSAQLRVPLKSIEPYETPESLAATGRTNADGEGAGWPNIAVNPLYLADAIEQLVPDTVWDVNVGQGVMVAKDSSGLSALIAQARYPKV